MDITEQPKELDEADKFLPTDHEIDSAIAIALARLQELDFAITEEGSKGTAQSYGWQRGGPLGETEVVLTDDNGADHVFRMETFFNSYEAMTLGVYVRSKAITSIGLYPANARVDVRFGDLF